MTITILGSVPAQKNDKRMAINRKTGKHFPVTSKAVKEWQKSAALQLMQYKGQAEVKVSIFYMFYVPDNRQRDSDNMVCSVNDALVKSGLLKSDSWQYLCSHGFDAEIDRDNPRVELEIKEQT